MLNKLFLNFVREMERILLAIENTGIKLSNLFIEFSHGSEIDSINFLAR